MTCGVSRIEDMEKFHQSKPFPEEWRQETHRIGDQYVRGQYDCDDMAKDMAKYLADWFKDQDMRIIYGYMSGPLGGEHAWLEVFYQGSWYVCDPSTRKWMCRFKSNGRTSQDRPMNWTSYSIYKEDQWNSD